jgi:hypothetical protein
MTEKYIEILDKFLSLHLPTASEVKLTIDEDKDNRTRLEIHITGLDEDPKDQKTA